MQLLNFHTVLGVPLLGVIEKKEFFLSENLFLLFDEQSKVIGEAKTLLAKEWLPAETEFKVSVSCQKLSDYLYPIIQAADCRSEVLHEKAATLSSRL